MKISFTFDRTEAEKWKFTDPKYEILIYLTSPFKFGFGFKRRKVDTKEAIKGDYIIPESGIIDKDRAYYEAEISFFRIWRHPISKTFIGSFNKIPVQTVKEEK